MNGRLPLELGSDRHETLPQPVSDDSQRIIVWHQKVFGAKISDWSGLVETYTIGEFFPQPHLYYFGLVSTQRTLLQSLNKLVIFNHSILGSIRSQKDVFNLAYTQKVPTSLTASLRT